MVYVASKNESAKFYGSGYVIVCNIVISFMLKL